MIIFILTGKWIFGIFSLIFLISIDIMVSKHKFRKQLEREIEIWSRLGKKIDATLIDYIEKELWRRSRGKYTL
jgi:hypothetical protein